MKLQSQNAYAKGRGVSQSYVSGLVKRGVIPTVEGKIDVDAANKILDERQAKATPAPEKKTKGKLDGAHERARLAKSKADFQEIENAKASGLLVEKSGVREKIEQQYDAIRQKFLSMPNKIAPQVVGMDPKEAAGFIRAHIIEAFEELSSDAVLETEDCPDFLSRRASA